jgi:hypothetical protein
MTWACEAEEDTDHLIRVAKSCQLCEQVHLVAFELAELARLVRRD